MNPLNNLPNVQQPTPSQKAAMTCPTCKKPKDWDGNKPGNIAKPVQKFRPLSVKRGVGRPRIHARDRRFVEFY